MKSENLELVYRGGWRADYIASDKNPNEPMAHPLDDANTIMSRECRGIGNFGSNVVIEVYEIK